MNVEYLLSFSSENQAAIIGASAGLIGVIVGVILTKLSELIQFTNRQARRASWPTYKIISNYDGDNITIINPKEHGSLDLKIYTQGLIESGGRDIEINGYRNIQTDSLQLSGGEAKELILNLKKFNSKKYFIFYIQVKYMCNGFYYTDYCMGKLVRKNNGYQIKFYPPVEYYSYIIQVLKSYFKRTKPHPWEE